MVLLKRIIIGFMLTLVTALAVAALSTSAASGDAGIQPPAQSVFCLNGNTVREGDDMSPFLNWLPEAEPFEFILSEGTAALFRNRIEANGGSWTFTLFEVDGEGNIIRPLTMANTITEGACDAPGQVFSDRNFWLCFSKSRNPAVYSRGVAMKLYEDGYTVPHAIQAPVSDTNIGNGVYLTCNLPTGYTVKSGVAVSTGGGEIYGGPADLVNYMLTMMPLDYTVLAVPS